MSGGVWIVVAGLVDLTPVSVWPDELSARRDADQHGYGEVLWWPWGSWDNATKEIPDEGIDQIERERAGREETCQ